MMMAWAGEEIVKVLRSIFTFKTARKMLFPMTLLCYLSFFLERLFSFRTSWFPLYSFKGIFMAPN